MAESAARQAGQSISGEVEAGEAAELAESVGLKAGRRRRVRRTGLRLAQDFEPLKAAQAGKGAGRDDLHGAVLQGQLSVSGKTQTGHFSMENKNSRK